MVELIETAIKCWPNKISEVAPDIRPYWSIREQISVHDGLVLKGCQVIIPTQMQPEILRQLHIPHLGQEKTKLLARECVYWPNYNRDIENLIKTCQTWQRFMPLQQSETLLPHEIPTKP